MAARSLKVADGYPRKRSIALATGASPMNKRALLLFALALSLMGLSTTASSAKLQKAYLNGEGIGWRDLTADDFQQGNVDPGTFTWKGNGFDCTGLPIGVTRS